MEYKRDCQHMAFPDSGFFAFCRKYRGSAVCNDCDGYHKHEKSASEVWEELKVAIWNQRWAFFHIYIGVVIGSILGYCAGKGWIG